MDVRPTADEERRCPSCGALATSDVQWCGQCFAVLTDPEPAEPEPEPELAAPEPATAPGAVAEHEPTEPGSAGKAPTWPCPACGNDNAIELDVCRMCGTPFAALMRQDEQRPEVDPKSALLWSLVFPGLGHRKVGRSADGLARGVLFAMLFAMALVAGLSGLGSAAALGLFALYLGLAIVVYAGSAFEAYRLAEGGEPIVSSRALLWVTVGVIMFSVVLLALTVVTAARR